MTKKVQNQISIVAILCIVCALFFAASGCKGEIAEEIPFSIYSNDGKEGEEGSGLDLAWKGLSFDNKVIIVNSREEMEKYIAGDIGDYPDIDFSRYTLLLASGETSNGIFSCVDKFRQISLDEYRLDVEIVLDDTTIIGKWQVALTTNKLSSFSKINLNVKVIGN